MRRITPRNWQAAQLLCRGLSDAEIAAEMGCEKRTVKAHLKKLYMLFDIDDRWIMRVRLVYVLWQKGMIAEIEKGNPCTNS